MSASDLRSDLLKIIGENPGGHEDAKVRESFAAKLQEYSKAKGADPSDVIFAIGKAVFGVELEASPPPAKKAKTVADDLPIVDFDYMKQFMKEVFLTYGVTPERAEICSEVLIESDKRGIDSHGLGRLKPIYCDRMDNGILYPDKPIDIVSESDSTALVDGNLGLGLYIGPHCMQMAIDKAKKHGAQGVALRALPCLFGAFASQQRSRAMGDRERSPYRGGGGGSWSGGGGGGQGYQGGQNRPYTGVVGVQGGGGGQQYNGARPFTGVRNVPVTTSYASSYQASRAEQSGPVDPLDAYMASVQRELDRTLKGRKQKVGDVASAREAFGPAALQKLRPGGFEARDTDALQEDKLLR